MTVIEALRKSVEVLNGVNIPISMIEKIGMPVQQATALIQASLTALEQNAQEQEQPEQAGEDEEHDA